jgi:hypothetical protein
MIDLKQLQQLKQQLQKTRLMVGITISGLGAYCLVHQLLSLL